MQNRLYIRCVIIDINLLIDAKYKSKLTKKKNNVPIVLYITVCVIILELKIKNYNFNKIQIKINYKTFKQIIINR